MDSTVIVVRQGRDLRAIHRYQGEDTMTIVGRVIEAIEEYRPTLTVIDEGGLGYGILDRLTEQRYKVRGVNFGSKSNIEWLKKKNWWCHQPSFLRYSYICPKLAMWRFVLNEATTTTNSPGFVMMLFYMWKMNLPLLQILSGLIGRCKS